MDLSLPIQNHLGKGVNLLVDLASFPLMYLDSRLDKNKLFRPGLRTPGMMKPYKVINKAKHPKKGECKEQNGRTHV
jgi:hypothetical protein